ncbi:hypothetical protein [Streptomyces cavernae]
MNAEGISAMPNPRSISRVISLQTVGFVLALAALLAARRTIAVA